MRHGWGTVMTEGVSIEYVTLPEDAVAAREGAAGGRVWREGSNIAAWVDAATGRLCGVASAQVSGTDGGCGGGGG